MKKRLLLCLALVLLPVAAMAQVSDRDTLLTGDGTLYSIESQGTDASTPDAPHDCLRYLVLTTQDGTTSTRTVVPESLTAGVHWRPALAYDSDSKSLFVFWLHSINASSSELLFSSLHENKWSGVTHFEDGGYRVRSNLRIAVTRRVSESTDDGSYILHPGTTVHAVWWEQRGDGESARYAMLTIENGDVASIAVRDMLDFLPYSRIETPTTVASDFDREVFRHPAIVESATHDTVDVLFADWDKNHYNRLTVRPIANARPHVPIGVRSGGNYGPPKNFRVGGQATTPFTSVQTLFDRDSNDIIIYYQTADALRYAVNRDGQWSAMKSIALGPQITSDVATSALRKLLATQ